MEVKTGAFAQTREKRSSWSAQTSQSHLPSRRTKEGKYHLPKMPPGSAAKPRTHKPKLPQHHPESNQNCALCYYLTLKHWCNEQVSYKHDLLPENLKYKKWYNRSRLSLSRYVKHLKSNGLGVFSQLYILKRFEIGPELTAGKYPLRHANHSTLSNFIKCFHTRRANGKTAGCSVLPKSLLAHTNRSAHSS